MVGFIKVFGIKSGFRRSTVLRIMTEHYEGTLTRTNEIHLKTILIKSPYV
jgi:hypothetical protein